MYSLVKRQAEVELLPWRHQRVIGIPLPRRGRFLENIRQTGRLTTNKMYQARYGEDGYMRRRRGLPVFVAKEICIP